MASDAIFNVTHGYVKPWKHIAMGLGMTSLTGSKLAIQILNRAGHSISYSEAKGLETEFAYSVSSDGNSAPDGIQLLPNRATACVWGNNDANIETLDGKSTLHSTVGHTYQNIYEGDGENLPEIRFREEKKRRTYIGIQQEILPYRKSLKTASFVLDTDGMEDSAMWPGHYVTELDLYWLLRLSKGEVPLYAGYMSNFITDPLPLQRISYMDPISKSPTDNAVVRETMIRTMNVAKETGQEYAIVTYDLAVALKAYSIQALDSPLFDKLLIMLGNFHIELAFFGAVGTLINESGIEFILAESDVLAEGSMLGFFKGKFYNRCVRIHEIVSNVLEQKLYDRFLQEISFDEYQIVHELFCNISDKCALKDQLSDPIISLHVKKYNDFFQSVIEGACGPTAKFWGIYIYLINRVHRQIQRCIKTNDVDGYITTFPAMLDVFFSLNRPNYARWGTLFLQKLTSSDPAIRDILKQGAFTVRRTKKNYSRSAVDISLEQTVNRDAASNLRGIVSFRNSENAIRRWHLTMTQRAMAVMELRSLAGLEVGEHAAAQCQPSRIRRDYKQMQALSEKIEEFCNPFNVESNNFLVNLATGRAANDETKNYLLGTLERRKTARENFKNEWLKDPSIFLKPVKRITVENFATEVEKRKKTLKVPLEIKEKKNAESLKDMFIRLVVAVAEKTNYNLLHVIQYPITTYPLSLAHPDGTPLKTQKSALLKRLESFQKYHLAVANDNCIHIFDGGLVMHSVLSNSNAGASFGSIATSILSMICSGQHNSPVHICFDKYVENSIKSSERKLRGATNTLYFITGADQRIRSRGDKLLLNANFKNELGKFLITEWQKDHYWSFLLGKTVTASFGGNCVTLEPNEENGIVVSHPDHLQGDHEEADTLIAFHVSKLVMTNPVIVRASDTDILVILINMLSKLCLNACSQSEIIMDCGVGNNRRYINVSEIVSALEELKPGLAGSLIGYHAFTGCDFTAAFYRKGKVKHLEILSKDETGKFINFFSGMRNIDNEINIEVASEFVCRMYGETGADVDVARHRKLVKMAGSAGKDNPLANIRRIDCALLPPTRRCLEKKLLRSKYVSIIWDRADSASPCQQITPLDYGWSIHDNFLFPTWFDGPSVPECLFPENETEDQESEEFEDEPWSEDSDSDSEI